MCRHDLQWLWLSWREQAAELHHEDPDDETTQVLADSLRECADDLKAALAGEFDYTSSASRQHYIETGRYLKHGESE